MAALVETAVSSVKSEIVLFQRNNAAKELFSENVPQETH